MDTVVRANVCAHLPTLTRQPHRHRTDVDVMTPHRDHIDVNDIDVTVKPLTQMDGAVGGGGGRLDLTYGGDPDRPQQNS